LAGVFPFALGKAFFAESFLFDSRQRGELLAKPWIPVVIARFIFLLFFGRLEQARG
jgi:hypothetical protein